MRRLPAAAWAVLAVAWALLVWWLLTANELPGAPMVTHLLPVLFWPGLDKLGHAALFFVQALLVERATGQRLGAGRSLAIAFVLCLLLGATTEVRQRRLPHRDADPLDFAADALGAMGAGVALGLGRRGQRLAAGAPSQRRFGSASFGGS